MSLIRAYDGGLVCTQRRGAADCSLTWREGSRKESRAQALSVFLRGLCPAVVKEACFFGGFFFALWIIDEVSCCAAVLLINNLSLLCASGGS